MVTVFKYRKIRFQIYSKEHPPAHVHIISAEARCKINLQSFEVMENFGFSKAALKKLIAEVSKRSDELLAYWENYHGRDEK